VPVSGTYKVDVKLGGTSIIGSPFFVKSFDKSKVRVFGLSDGVVNKMTTFTGSSVTEIYHMSPNAAFTRGDRRRNRSAQPVGATIAPTVATTIVSCKLTAYNSAITANCSNCSIVTDNMKS